MSLRTIYLVFLAFLTFNPILSKVKRLLAPFYSGVNLKNMVKRIVKSSLFSTGIISLCMHMVLVMILKEVLLDFHEKEEEKKIPMNKASILKYLIIHSVL